VQVDTDEPEIIERMKVSTFILRRDPVPALPRSHPDRRRSLPRITTLPTPCDHLRVFAGPKQLDRKVRDGAGWSGLGAGPEIVIGPVGTASPRRLSPCVALIGSEEWVSSAQSLAWSASSPGC
jgi:hypothetical protein